MTSAVNYKVCRNCGLVVKEAKTEKINNESYASYSYCLWRNKLTKDALLKKEIINGCKDFMEKITAWTPQLHFEEKLKHFSIENVKFANVLSIVAVVISIIAIVLSVFKK